MRATAQDRCTKDNVTQQIFTSAELVLFLTDKIAVTWTSATKRLTHTRYIHNCSKQTALAAGLTHDT